MNGKNQGNVEQMLNKVPEVMIWFWIIKVLATTIGETAADFLNFSVGLGMGGTSLVMGVFLAITLLMQVRASAYTPWLYWMSVVLISIVGTLISDNLVDNYGLSLAHASAGFGTALLATFLVWYRFERTLSIHAITTRRRELFYWLAILLTFSLGTAGGDLLAEGYQLGYANATLVFAGAIGCVVVAHYLFRANAVASFWIAYILTRPLGASFGDLLAQPASNGGLGFGTVITSAIFLLAIALLVVYLTFAGKKELAYQNAIDNVLP